MIPNDAEHRALMLKLAEMLDTPIDPKWSTEEIAAHLRHFLTGDDQ